MPEAPKSSPAPQNVYDDPRFYAGYAELRRSGTGLNEVLEQPALHRLLPPSLRGLRILDLGCGFGDFARAARAHGAASVVGIDASERMLAEAHARTDDPAITFRQIPIEALAPEDPPFDLVVSSLALHYVADYRGALRRIAALLVEGGHLVFSVEHPICTALPEQQWCRGVDGAPNHWPVDRYRDEGPRATSWFIDGVTKYHRTVETYVNGLLDEGFRLTRLEEPAPLDDALARNAALGLHRRRPPFLLLAATRLWKP